MNNKHILGLISILMLTLALGVAITFSLGSISKAEVNTEGNLSPRDNMTTHREVTRGVYPLADEISPGQIIWGYLSGTGQTKMYSINVGSNVVSMHTALRGPGYPVDFDIYGRLGAEPTISTYDWRGYMSGDEDVTFDNPGAGVWYIMVRAYSGSGSYRLWVDLIGDNYEELSSTISKQNSLSSPGQTKTYYIEVNDDATSMRTVLTCPGADFDVYGRLGAPPALNNYDWRGYTSSGEDVTFNNPGAGIWYIMVRAFSGSGNFELTVTLTGNYPTLSNGVPFQGSLYEGQMRMHKINVGSNALSIHALLEGPSFPVDLDLYGQLGREPSTSIYGWECVMMGSQIQEEITYYEPRPGAWYIMVHARSGGGSYKLTVSITYDPYKKLSNGVTNQGYLSGTGQTEIYYIKVAPNANSMRTILTCTGVDFDVYGRQGALPTTSVYDWRGYTSGGEDVTFNNPGTGTWYIMVRSYRGSGSYQLRCSLNYPNTGKYAILAGIADYKNYGDLRYTRYDAGSWYDFLTTKGYLCSVYGDGHSDEYPWYNDRAREAAFRIAIRDLASVAQPGDTVVIVHSGHGNGDYQGESYLAMWDCGNGDDGEDGRYTDDELAEDLSLFAYGVKIFVFLDACLSGGMGPELMQIPNKVNVYCTTTCSESGYGYENPHQGHGDWDYEFLIKYLMVNPTWSMENTFIHAKATYGHTGADAPMEFDGNTGSYFYL